MADDDDDENRPKTENKNNVTRKVVFILLYV